MNGSIGLYRIVQDCNGLYWIVQEYTGPCGIVRACTVLYRVVYRTAVDLCRSALVVFIVDFCLLPRSCGSSLGSVLVNHSVLHVLSLYLLSFSVFSFLFSILSSPHFQTHHGQ